MWRSFLARVLIWFVALAGLGLYAAAQTNTGNVYGTVTDEQGSAMPGGTATLTGPTAPQTTTVNGAGQFRFLKVPPNKYTVVVTLPGFTTVTQENVIVTLGKSTNVDIKMRISNVQENVVVSGATPLIDTRKVETGATFSHDELAEIPTARNVWNLMQQIPGVQLDTVDVAGASSAQTGGPDFISKGSGNVAYKVDGSTITDNTYGNPFGRQNGGTNTFFDFDTFQNVEVVTGGSLLEQENSGVTINVVTKRGTNELKGSARFLYADHAWQGDNRSQDLIDQGFQTSSIRYIREWGGELGGPIVKDKLWLWAAGSRQDISTTPVALSLDTRATQTVTLVPWNAKLNWQVSSDNALNLFFQRSNRTEFGHISTDVTTRPPDTRTDRLIPTNFYKLEDNEVFSPDLFASVFLNYQDVNYSDFPKNPNVQMDYYAGAWHNSWTTYLAKDPQRQANLQVSKFFNTGKVNHELKVSFNYRQQIADSTTGLPGDQIWGYESSSTALVSRSVRTVFKTQIWSGTIGDTLTTGNLTINAGVRADLQRGRNLPGTSFANPVYPDVLPTVSYHGAPNWQFVYKNWQPRASVSYALGEKKNTLLRASYGRFADQLGFVSYYGSGVPISNGYYYTWTDTNGNHHVDPGEIDITAPLTRFYNSIDPAVLPNVPNRIQAGYQTPLTDEITAGADHQIFEDFAVSGTFSYRHTNHLQDTIPIGTSASTYALLGNASGDFTLGDGSTHSFSVPYYGLTLGQTPTGVLLYNRPTAYQRYLGADITLVKRLSHNWMVRASFGWNDFRQFITQADITDPNNLWGVGGQNDNNTLAVGYSSKAYLFINGSWQFNVTGLYQFPLGVNLGANFFGRQGYPFLPYVRVLTGDIADNRPRILIGKAGDFRLDNLYQLDLRLEKTFTIGRVAITPAAEVFNVINSGTVLQRYSRVGTWDNSTGTLKTDLNFNSIQETQSPRILRLGMRVAF